MATATRNPDGWSNTKLGWPERHETPDGRSTRPPDGIWKNKRKKTILFMDDKVRDDWNLSSRKSARAEFSDYSDGDFFVTVCTEEKVCLFGKISDSEIHFTPIGSYCNQQLMEISKHYPYAKVLVHQVMPNHYHAIIRIDPGEIEYDRVPKIRKLLGVVVGGMKSAVTSYARKNNISFGWQKRFHDHIIRDSSEGDRIWEYIISNVENWEKDCFHITRISKLR